MFLLTLLVLLMSIQVIYACQCEEVDWERVMCPGENKTVILGNAIAVSRATLPGASDVTLVHTVEVQKIFKEGPFNLTILPIHNIVINDKIFEIVSLHVLGVTDSGGILHSSNCTLELLTGFFEKSGRESLVNIYWGHGSPKC
ncbi:hypothetical protein ACJMK2_004410 [Sinanodonta woodiana]|uniref:Uncharacterized protein n=1 Tax=Sinanodonta woodiana TaxID=1069815 RepID=A0ABD3Y135_SINWO